MNKDHIVSFSVGVAFTLAIFFFTIFALKIELPKKPIIYAENRTPDTAYIDIISHTEYYANETGQVIIRVSDYLGNPLNASCNATIIYPNKTFWYIDTPLSNSSIIGNYYKEITIPDVLGVYEYSFVCNATMNNKNYIIKKSSSFHVSIAYQMFQEIIDKLDALNNTLIQMNQSINNLEINMNNNFTYTNSLIQNISVYINMTNVTEDIKTNITTQLKDMRSWQETWFLQIQSDIYNLQQKWIEFLDQFLTRLLGSSKILQDVVGQSTGVSTSCSLINRILGTCPSLSP
jgi:hypothetical protein